MKPETEDYLSKAREDLDEARKIAAIGLTNLAGRSAYFAVFHAAEALIMERTGKVGVSHKGVRIEFARLARHEPELKEYTAFLTRAYDFKAIADYSVRPRVHVSPEDAQAAIMAADRMLSCIANLVAAPASAATRQHIPGTDP